MNEHVEVMQLYWSRTAPTRALPASDEISPHESLQEYKHYTDRVNIMIIWFVVVIT